jgi:hypothetical protein
MYHPILNDALSNSVLFSAATKKGAICVFNGDPTFAHTTFAQRHLPRTTFAQKTFAQKDIFPDGHLPIRRFPRRYLPKMTFAQKDICPERHLPRIHLPRRTFAQKDMIKGPLSNLELSSRVSII